MMGCDMPVQPQIMILGGAATMLKMLSSALAPIPYVSLIPAALAQVLAWGRTRACSTPFSSCKHVCGAVWVVRGITHRRALRDVVLCGALRRNVPRRQAHERAAVLLHLGAD